MKIRTVASTVVLLAVVGIAGCDSGNGDSSGQTSGGGSVGGGVGTEALDCLNESLQTIGTRIEQVIKSTDSASGVVITTTSDATVMRETTFKGNTAIEAEADVDADASDPAYSSTSTTLTYTKAVPDTSVLTYGVVTEATASGFTFTTTVSNEPAREFRYNLDPGQGYSQSYTVSVETMGVTTTTDISETVEYIGKESVTVPAGTFEACKFETSSAGNTTTEWFAVGSGMFLKSESGGDESVLISAAIDGTAVTP